jgi:hypothetical protein
VIHYDLNRSGGTFKVVSPYPKGFVYCKELFVVDIIIQFGGGECSGMESDQMNLSVVWRDNGLDCCEGIIGGVSFEEDQSIWNPMSQYWSSGEGLFQGLKAVRQSSEKSHLSPFLVSRVSRTVMSE